MNLYQASWPNSCRINSYFYFAEILEHGSVAYKMEHVQAKKVTKVTCHLETFQLEFISLVDSFFHHHYNTITSPVGG